MTDDMINEAARVVLARQNGVEDYDPNPWELPPFRALAETGLLADPEQAAEWEKLKTQVTNQEQVLQIVRAQSDACVAAVDTALGHRYHTAGIHYSIPHVAEKAAAELNQLQARINDALALIDTHNGHFGLMFRDDLRVVLQHGALCEACGRPRTPHHDASAPGPTMKHPYRAALKGNQPDEPNGEVR